MCINSTMASVALLHLNGDLLDPFVEWLKHVITYRQINSGFLLWKSFKPCVKLSIRCCFTSIVSLLDIHFIPINFREFVRNLTVCVFLIMITEISFLEMYTHLNELHASNFFICIQFVVINVANILRVA